MPQNDGEVRVEITGDSSKIKKELKETESAVQNTTKFISDMMSDLENKFGASNIFSNIVENAKEKAKSVSNFFTTAAKSANNAINAAKQDRLEKQKLEETQKQNSHELALYQYHLKAKLTELEDNLALRKISEEEYYNQLGKYLRENANPESKVYTYALDKYKNYLDQKQSADGKAAEKENAAAKKLLKEQQDTEKKRINDSVTNLKDRLEADKNYTKEMYYNNLEHLISTLDNESELYKKYNSEILKGRRNLADAAEKEAEKLLSEQEKTVEKSLSNIIKNFQKAYDELDKKRENYKKKLLSIGGDIFSVNEIENPDGSTTTEYAVNNISEQLKKVREFHSAVMKLKNEGASKGLLEELTSLDDDKSAEFAKYLARMSEAEFSKINALYNEKQKLAEELSNELYADEYKEISDGINSALDEASAGAADKGKEAAESYAKAFSAELEKHSEDFYALLGNSGVYKKWFENSSDTPNLFDIISGDTGKLTKLFMDSNFADIAAKVASTVSSEQARYSAAAYTAPVIQNNYDTSKTSEFKKSAELDEILKKLNKPVQVVLDGKVIAETVMKYQKDYRRQSGG